MVQVQVARSYYDDEEPGLRRYSRHGYALGHERESPHGPYEGHPGRDHLSASHHESRGGSRAPEPDNARPRSRIPVACGRCRKRKIRCSGDAGTGQPCTNCKNSGNEQCQFLRVSSQGMQMKNESIDFSAFEATSAPPRLQTHMLPYRPHATTHHQLTQQVVPDGYYAGRTSISGYQYPTSRYYGLNSFNDYSEDTVVDYGVQSTNNPYQLMGSEHLLSSSLPSSYGKWSTPAVQATQLIKNNSPASLYSEHDSNYHPNSHLSYQSGYQLRPTNNPEDVKNPSIVHSSLGTSSLGGESINSMPAPDRVLPVPATNRSSFAAPTNSYSYIRSSSTAALPSSQNQQTSWQTYDGLMGAAHTLSSVKSLPQSDSSYLYASSPESLSSSQTTAYSSQSLSSSQNDLYTTSSADPFHGNESTESSYGPSSIVKRNNQANASEASISSINNTLANGHPYIPFPTQASYPAPPMHSMAAPTPTRRLTNLPLGISAS